MSHIRLAEEVGKFCVAIEDGEKICRKMLRELVFTQEPIIIDFTGVETATCFVGTITVPLFQVFDSMEELRSRISYINIPDIEINRCLEHGLKYATDPDYRKRIDDINQRFADGGSF